MGSSISKQEIDMVNEVVNRSTTNVFSKIDQTIANTTGLRQDLKVHLNRVKMKDASFVQSISADIQYVSELSAGQALALKNEMQSEADAKIEAAMKIVRELGSQGGEDEQKIAVKNAITQIIENNVNQSTINKIISNTMVVQNGELYIDGSEIDSLNFNQNIQLQLVSSSLAKAITESIMDNTILARVKADASVKFEKEEKGVGSLITGLINSILGNYIILIVGVLAIGGVMAVVYGKQMLQPKFIAIVFVIVLVSGVILYFLKWFPFNNVSTVTELTWGCETKLLENGKTVNTGNCTQDTKDPRCLTEDSCKKLIADRQYCLQYWGCEEKDGYSTGNCVQYDNPEKGPYYSKTECESARQCVQNWGCEQKGGYNTGNCMEFKISEKPKLTYSSKDQCINFGCPSYYVCANQADHICDRVASKMANITTYPNNSDCVTKCKL